jgi:hypothetical protein
VIQDLETAGLTAAVVILTGAWMLFWVYVTDADQGRLKRAMACWWHHRWRREGNSWGRLSCSSCEHAEYGRRHMDRLDVTR